MPSKNECSQIVWHRLQQRREGILGGWYLKEYLGSGASGCVFRIEKQLEGVKAVSSALKVIPSSPFGKGGLRGIS
ncbi:hypothetical protein D5085_04150 [Ectothiorhodospiraceae bacterium BW-2]|nr:hypothetical protein D5085_04150 [Ectothiorhodospiraceae bacterium BW-2]